MLLLYTGHGELTSDHLLNVYLILTIEKNHIMKNIRIIILVFLFGCQTTPDEQQTRVVVNTITNDVQTQGVGIESSNIIAMAEIMAKDIIESGTLTKTIRNPKVIIDSAYFVNDSSSIIDKNILTDRLRAELIKLAASEVSFVSRQNVAMVSHEREVKSSGTVAEIVDNKNKLIIGGRFSVSRTHYICAGYKSLYWEDLSIQSD